MAHTIQELLTAIMHRLAQTHPKDQIARQQDAFWLLQAVTKKSEAELLAHPSLTLTPAQEQQLETWLTQHIEKHEPLQYILGSVPFNDLEIFVQPPTLIPRPETEEWTFNLVETLSAVRNEKLAILDIGCGTGCIALMLANAFPSCTVYAVDVSANALDLAQKNAVHNNIGNVKFLKSDVYDQIPSHLKFDLIVSNPPYIAPQDWQTLSKSVTEWEDKQALIAEDHGLAIIKRIITGAQQLLNPQSPLRTHHLPQLVFEIDYHQGPAVLSLLAQTGFHHPRIHKDLEGKDRVASAEWQTC